MDWRCELSWTVKCRLVFMIHIPDRGVENMDVQRSVIARWKKIVSVILLLAELLMYVTEK